MSTSEMHRPHAEGDAEGSSLSAGGQDGPGADRVGGMLRIDPTRTPERRLQLDAVTASVPVARHSVRRALDRLLPHDRLDRAVVETLTADLELAASELVTNAVEHGEGRSLQLSVSCDGEAVGLEVVSHGGVERVAPATEWRIADVGSLTGRGLGIVRALSDRVAVSRRADILAIRIERDLPI